MSNSKSPALVAVLMAAFLGACATAAGVGYQPLDARGFGFSEFRIESDRYRVVFAGDGGTPRDAVEAFALRRAGELALANGFDWFRVVGMATDRDIRGGVNVGAGGDLGRVGAREFFTTRMEVLMGKGTPPEDAEVYDARSLMENIPA